MMKSETVSLNPRILLVDDREDNLLSIEAILKQDGYQFTMAYSGNEALKILNKESDFAMILMDVKMPTLSGFETATLIYERESLKHIPIIFITANYYGEENLFKGYQSGGIDYIFKPINPEVLRAKVSIFTDLYRKNRMLVEQDEKLVQINRDLTIEIESLRASEAKLTLINRNLHKRLADFEALMGTSGIPVEQSEFVNSDLNELLEGLLKDMKEEIESATISVDRLPSLYISPRLMRPLFKNLIRNALLHRKENIDPIIRIHSDICHENNGINRSEIKEKYCHIFVEDNGNGLQQSFSGDTYGEFCDRELGFGFCRKVMEHHQGSISTKSKTDHGLTYVISLPLTNNHTE
jgi:CheY-like chemotaxis protein